ncbi:MAG: hypothetical protein AB8B55_15915 [Mariniblastus sp.]
MKGLLVTLLTFLMTGIVVGQQENSVGDRSTFGPPKTSFDGQTNPASATRAQNPFADNSGGGRQIDPNLVLPLELAVSNFQLQALKRGEPVRAKVEAKAGPDGPVRGPEYISGIYLTSPENELKQLPLKRVFGKASRYENQPGEVLVVTLDDQDLVALEQKKLRCEIEPADRGRFSEVYFRYEPPQVASTPARPTPADNRPSTQFSAQQPRQANRPAQQPTRATQQSQSRPNSLVQNPGPEPEPGEYDYMGPYLDPTVLAKIQNKTAWDQQPNQGNEVNPAFDRNKQFGAQGNQFATNGNRQETAEERYDRLKREMEAKEGNQFQNGNRGQRLTQAQLDQQQFEERQRNAWRAEQAQLALKEAAEQEAQEIAAQKEADRIRRAKWEYEQYVKQQADLLAAKQRLANLGPTGQWKPNTRGGNEPNPNAGYGLLNNGSLSNSQQPRLTEAEYLLRKQQWDNEQKDKKIADLEAELYRKSLRPQNPGVNDYATGQSQITPSEYGGPSTRTPPVGRVPGTIHFPTGPIVENQLPSPERFASRTDIGIKNGINNAIDTVRQGRDKFVASIPGNLDRKNSGQTNTGLGNQMDPDSDTSLAGQDNKTSRLIYFLLLVSLGLNAYLGLISRSFYVRYNELADELRETFTATS